MIKLQTFYIFKMVISKYTIRLKLLVLKPAIISVKLHPDHIFYGEGKGFGLEKKNKHR